MKYRPVILLILLMINLSWFYSCKGPDQQKTVLLNHVQVIGSHNSYKQAIQEDLYQYLITQDSSVRNLRYEHPSLTTQLDMGLRKIELDIFHDPDGLRYMLPLGNKILKASGIPTVMMDTSALSQPGYKVFLDLSAFVPSL